MNKKIFKEIMSNWKEFINDKHLIFEDNVKDISIERQLYKARSLIENNLNTKIKILIKKEGREYSLSANLVDSKDESRIIKKIGHIVFSIIYNYQSIIDLEGNERDVFKIDHTAFVNYGLGPFMYDIVLEFVSKQNAVLCADRDEVSLEAKELWSNYFKRRKDVKNVQMDIENEDYEKLTPDYIYDDINQDVAIKDTGEEKWFESPLSKCYYKTSFTVTEFILNKEYCIYLEFI